MKKKSIFLLVIFSAVIAFGVAFDLIGIQEARAALFVVDDTVADGAPNSLRDAIEQANAAAGQDTIVLRPGQYLLSMGQLEIQQDLIVRGSGINRTTIDGGGNDRVFSITTAVNPDIRVVIRGVTMTGGVVRSEVESVYGAGIYNQGDLTIIGSRVIGNMAECIVPDDSVSAYAFGGGISNYGDSARLTLIGSEVTGNTAASGWYNSGSFGGGVYSEGNLVIRRSRIDENISDSDIVASGGGICIGGNNSSVRIMGSNINGNSSDALWWLDGAGMSIYGDNVTLTLVSSNIMENTIYGDESRGGGIYNAGDNVVLTLRRCQVSRNSIFGYDAYGGGICTFGSSTEMTLTNSSVDGNTVTGDNFGMGGGISGSSGSRLVLIRSRVRNNSVAANPPHGGGIYWHGDLTVRGSLIARNEALSRAPHSIPSHGGGIYVYGNNSFNLIGSRVIQNTVSSDVAQEGGGVWIGSSITYTPRRSVIRDNVPDDVFIESDE